MISVVSLRSQMASLVASEQPMYSASRVDKATTDWLRDIQEISPPLTKM
jgi:hypothetical protein